MTNSNWYAAASAIVFFWCGAVVVISFLEAWLKFRAPGVTLPVGLSIGRVVFSALNKLEWVLLAASATCGLSAGWWPGAIWLLVATGLLILETCWLLPVLDKRAVAYMAGEAPGPSSLHLLFVAAEALKVGSLIIGGIDLIKRI